MFRTKMYRRYAAGLFAALMLGFLFQPSMMYGQFSASMSGTVADDSGAVIPGATVVLTNLGTQAKQTVVTSGEGFYRFNQLSPGKYSVQVDAKGFKSSHFDTVDVAAETPRSLDVTLSTGVATETVTVNADTVPLLQTSDASVGGTIDGDQVVRLPVQGRDPYELLRTQPGITGDGARSGAGGAVFLPNAGGPGQSNSGIFQTENQLQISANGQRIADNNFMIDGVSVNSLGFGGAAVVTPNSEAVGQITIVSTSYSAEDGRNTGAQVKVVTKGGTNSFHGSANFQYDEPGLNAYNKYGGPTGQLPVRVENKLRNYAGSLGGPVIRDKGFLFLSFEGFSGTNASFASQFVETPEFRSFLSSQRSGGISAGITAAPGGLPRIVKVLPVSCTQPVMEGDPCQAVGDGLDLGSPYGALGTYVPLLNASSGNGPDGIPDVQYVQVSVPTHSRGKQWNARGDYAITVRDELTASIYVTKLDSLTAGSSAGARPNTDIPFKPLNSALTAIYSHTFGPSLINEFRANATRFADDGIKDAGKVVDFGLPFINIQNMPFDSVNDVQFGTSFSPTTPAKFAENTYEIRDQIIKNFGSHTIKAGGEYRWEQDNNNLSGASRPTYAFGGIWNYANDTPIYEGIYADPRTGGVPNTARYLHDHYIGLFVQHDWKATPNLTLNMGLRWENFEPIYNKGLNINYPVFGTTPGRELIDVALVPRNHLWDADYKDFSPKFGFAWTPSSLNHTTVVRGGFAIAYNRLNDALFDPAVEDGPGYFSYGVCCGTATTDFGTPFVGGQIQYERGTSRSPFSFAPNAALATGVNSRGLPNSGASIEVYGAAQHLPVPRSYLYSLEVQRELPKQFTATVGYQGSTGRHYSRLVNQLFLYATSAGGVGTPFGNGAYIAQNDSNQYYNAFNAHLVKRFNEGLTIDAIYSWSKSEDQVTSGDGANGSANQTDPAHNETELGPSDFDTRHRVTVTALWAIPGKKSGNGLVKAVTNGWQVNGIYTFHTGFPFTPVTYALHGIPVQGSATIGPVRPIQYYGGVHTSCDNQPFLTGSDVTHRGKIPGFGTNGFNITPPDKTPANLTQGTPPGIGRNSFRGPCYEDTDISIAKEQKLGGILGERSLIRFQANFFNVFNKLNLTPITNGNGNPAALIESSTFGIAQSAGAGRTIEFNARFQF